jgi:hypothetical protein
MGREKRRKGWRHEAGLRTRRRSLPSRFPPVKPPTGCTPHYSNYPSSQAHLRSPLLAIIPARMGSGDGLVHYIDHKRDGARGVEGELPNKMNGSWAGLGNG